MPSRDDLILEHLHLAERAARGGVRRISRTAEPLLDLEELRSIGVLALVQAAERFDPALKCPFGGYAFQRVNGAILDACRRTGSRTDEGKLTRRVPSDTESELKRFERVADVSPSPESLLIEKDRLEKRLRLLDARERRIVTARLRGESQAHIAQTMAMSEGRISQILTEVIKDGPKRMITSTAFPALQGKDALPALAPKNPKVNAGKLSHPLGKTAMQHPLAKGGCKKAA